MREPYFTVDEIEVMVCTAIARYCTNILLVRFVLTAVYKCRAGPKLQV